MQKVARSKTKQELLANLYEVRTGRYSDAKQDKKYFNSEVNCRKGHKYNDKRYYGLNLHSYFFRRTLEVRYHSATFNYDKIANWIWFHLFVVDFVSGKGLAQLRDIMTTRTPLQFISENLPYKVYSYITKRVAEFATGTEV